MIYLKCFEMTDSLTIIFKYISLSLRAVGLPKKQQFKDPLLRGRVILELLSWLKQANLHVVV